MVAGARYFAVLATTLLTACAGRTITEKLNSYQGRPASEVIAKLGHPMAEQTIAGSKVYIWTTGGLDEGTSYGCKIRIIVNPTGIITAWDFEGDQRGCRTYAARLDR